MNLYDVLTDKGSFLVVADDFGGVNDVIKAMWNTNSYGHWPTIKQITFKARKVGENCFQ